MKFILKKIILLLTIPQVRFLLLDIAEELAKKTKNEWDDKMVEEVKEWATRAR